MHPYIFIDNPLAADEEGNYLSEQPIIFESSFLGEPVPQGFNAVSISLQGGLNSDLNWQKQKEAAQDYISQGIKIFWQLDLGLFSNLKAPLSDSTQHLALGLALRHFKETMWSDYQSHTVGLSFYKGSIDFTHHFSWDTTQILALQGWLQDHFPRAELLSKELRFPIERFNQVDQHLLNCHPAGIDLLKLFCCDAAMEYITLLTDRLPGNLIPTILIDTHSIQNPLFLAQLLSKERFPRTNRAITNDPWKTDFHGSLSKVIPSKPSIMAKIGICLPSRCYPSQRQVLQNVWNDYVNQGIGVRPIAEENLNSNWEELDSIVVISDMISSEGQRKLHGFCASGGTVITIGKSLQLAQEISYCDIKENLDHDPIL